MMKHAITLSRFSRIIEAYGADPGCWPEAEQAAAERLLAQSAEARRLWKNAQRLDAVMNAAPKPAPASHGLRMVLVERIRQGTGAAVMNAGPMPVTAAASREQPLLARWWQALQRTLSEFGSMRPAGAALAVSLVLGIAASGMVMPTSERDTDIDLLELALLSDTFEGY